MGRIDPIPDREPLIEQGTSYIDGIWYRWLSVLRNLGANSTGQTGSTLVKTGQHAAITTTSLVLPALTNATYRVSGYLRVTTPDGVSSSVQLTLGWTESALTLSKTLAAVTGDTVTSVQDGQLTAFVDQGSALTYSTAYSSNTPGAMQYTLRLLVEQLAS
jgi:hypothetical protein